MKDIQQLIKKNSQEGRYEDIFPKTFIDAVKDKESGKSLIDILSSFNMYFLSYNGSRELTRLQVPLSLRKTGLWITYVLYDKTVVTEWYAGEAIDDASWKNPDNWRVGSNMLVGDISISSDGYWVVNGVVTTTKAQGEQGITPMLRVGSNNHLQVSYTNGSSWIDVSSNPVYTQFRVLNNKLQQSTDLGNTYTYISEELAYKFQESGNKLQMSKDLGNTWEDVSDYIAAWFRFTGTTGSSQANNVGKIQVSRDNGVTWTDLSGEFTNSLYIKGYVATVDALPSTAVQGDIYGVGPTYDPSDTGQTNPIYQLYVKDSTGWVNNGKFTSIAAGVVQITGTSTTEVMSQDAVTRELTELESQVELRKSSIFHINGENKLALGFNNFSTEHFHFSMDFVILPNKNNTYKDIVTITDSNDVVIPIGYYATGNQNWYIGEQLQSSIQYYKRYHLNIRYENNLLKVFINDILMKTFSVSSVLRVIFSRIPSEPTGEMLVNYLNFYDNQKFYGIDSITEHYSATLVENYILKEIEIMRSEQFDQIGSDKVQWVDGTIGDIQSLVFDENSLGVSSYIITYKDYVVTQPTITYNDDYQISNKPQIVITKSN